LLARALIEILIKLDCMQTNNLAYLARALVMTKKVFTIFDCYILPYRVHKDNFCYCQVLNGPKN